MRAAVAALALAFVGCNIFNDFGNAECNASNGVGCAAGGAPASTDCTGGATYWICNIKTDGVTTGFEPWPATDCGLGFCALDALGAKYKALGAVGVNPDAPNLVCLDTHTTTRAGFIALGLTAQALGQQFGVDPNDFGSLCVGTNLDAGKPCAHLGDTCSAFGSPSPECCSYQQVVSGGPASNLECEPEDINVMGSPETCRVEFGFPCNTDADCFQTGSPDGLPADCYDVCCLRQGRDCFTDGLTLNGGCCPGLSCVVDAIGNAYWCQ
jgi:hypothetical protein